MDYAFPVDGGNISSYYGYRQAPKLGATTKHQGLDIAVPVGSSVLSILDGVVSDVGYNKARGNYVTVDHGGGVQSLYQHLSGFMASKGDKVSQGQLIAKTGNTGISTGAHLHFEISKDGKAVDPLNFKMDAKTGGFDLSSLGGDILGGMDTNNILDFLKSNWWLIAGGLVIIAVLK